MSAEARAIDEPFPTLLGVALAGALAAAIAVFLPWAKAALSDRGTDLLVVRSSGHAAHFPGWWVLVLAVLAIVAAGAAGFRLVAGYAVLVAALAGVAIAVLAVTARHDNAPVVARLRHVRFGTFQYDQHIVTSSTMYGLWIAVAGGVVLAAGSLAWWITERRRTPAAAPTGYVPPA